MLLQVFLLYVGLTVGQGFFSFYNLVVPLQFRRPTKRSKKTSKRSPDGGETIEKWKSSNEDSSGLVRSNSISWNSSMKWATLISGLRLELFTMADGSHINFPLSEKDETDQQHRAISIAVSKLMMNLKTMVRADNVLENVLNNLLSNDTDLFVRYDFGREPLETIMRTLLQNFFIILDHQMKTDEMLENEYKKRVKEARETVKKYPKMREPLFRVWEESSKTKTNDISDEDVMKFVDDKKTLRRSVLNDFFLKYSKKHTFSSSDHELIERYSLVRALTQKAAASSISECEINDLYQLALVEADEEQWNKESSVQGDESFFNSLEKVLKMSPAVYEEVENLKEVIQTSINDWNQ